MNNQTRNRPWGLINIGLWVLQILTAAAFLLAGVAKLMGQPMMVETFETVGVGQWFRYVTGVIEIASAILLIIPRLSPLGAALLLPTMIGAVLAHLLVLHGSVAPAVKAWFASARARCATEESHEALAER